ncbi:MAG: AHH domain-containing protein [Christensenellales bacterium]
MNKTKKQFVLTFLFVLMLFSLAISFVLFPFAKVNAQSIVDLDGVDSNGAVVLNQDDKYLTTKSYEVENDTGYEVGNRGESFVLSKDGKGVTFAQLYVDTLGEGGEVLRGSEQHNGFDAYGYVAGGGEPIYQVDKDNNLVQDENGQNIIIGYKSIAVKLTYNFGSNDNMLGTDGKQWNISEDTWQRGINGISPVGVVGKGAVIIQKFVPTDDKSFPRSNDDWTRLNEYSQKQTDGIHTVNFFNEFDPSKNQTPIVLYTPDGNDLNNGLYIKITIAYELVNYEKNFFTTRKTYKNVVEETTFYLCNTSGEIVFENLSFSNSTQQQPIQSEPSTTLEQKGGIITNCQGSVEGFRINTQGSNFDVKYRFNGSGNYFRCNDGEVFFNPGRYDFKITTKLGLVRTKTIYVHEQGEENNARIYFGNSLFSDDSQRVFTTDSYPTFLEGHITLKTNLFSKNIYAPLVGKVYKLDGDWEEIERDDKNLPKEKLVSTKLANDDTWEFSDLEEGKYEAIFANNADFFDGETSGDTYKFIWRFSVVSEGQSPIINQTILETANCISDYDSIQYVVKLKSKGEGNLLVCFADESDAYDFANRYLVSKVQKTDDIYVFDDVSYATEKSMLEKLHQKAREMVSRHYFDATNPATFLTIKINNIAPPITDSSSEEQIEDYNNYQSLENTNLPRDIIVFYDENQSSALAAGEAYLNDRPYAYINEDGEIEVGVNSVKFISIADYESSSITLFNEGTDLVYDIPYGVSIQEFLDTKNAPSGRYRVVDKNFAGTTEFWAIYLCPGDMLSSIQLERTLNGITTEHNLNKLDNHMRIRANNVLITGAQNALDPYGIIKIHKIGGETAIYHMCEYADIPAIDQEGKYEIVLVDRIGRSIEFYVDIYSPNKVYLFKLVDNGNEILSARAYGGKKFALPSLEPANQKFVFGGWEDEEGNVFFDEYIFESPSDITLHAVWNYANVEITVYDGKQLDSFNSHVGDFETLPQVSKTGYDLFGYCFSQPDGTLRFYRGQINRVPNVETMRLDAVWTKSSDVDEIPQGTDEKPLISLVNGDIIRTVEGDDENILDLPELRTDGLEFVGWLYQYGLSGSIFKTQLNLNEITQICGEKQNSIKLTAVWKTADENGGSLISGTTSASGISSSFGGENTRQMSTKAKTSVISGVLAFVAILLATILAVVFAKRKKSTKQIDGEQVCEVTHQESQDEPQKPVTPRPHHVNAYKFKTFNFKKVFTRVLFPCLVAFMAFTMLFISQQGLMFSVRGYVDQKEYEQTIQTEISRQLDLEKDKADDEQEELLHDTFVRVQDTFATTSSSDTHAETQSTSSTDLSDEQAFLYTLVMLDLAAMGYDVFPAKAYVGDKILDGFGYSNYENIYETRDGAGILFGAGFVGLEKNEISQSDIDDGIIIKPIECDDDAPNYLFTFSEEWGPIHYISYGNYVVYKIQDYAINYASTIDTGDYDDSLGDVYNYDIGEITHYSNYGEEFKYDSYGIYSDINYLEVYEQLDEILKKQNQDSLTISVEKAEFISYQALSDYMASNQNEAMLGVDADALLQYEAQMDQNQYYVIMADGTVQVLTLPPDPEEKASIWERIWMGLIAVTGVILGVVVASIPGVGPYLSGAIIAASIDLFMQVTVSGVACEDINWASVGASAVTGLLTAGIGSVTSAATKAAVSGIKNVVAKFFIEAGIQLASGLFSGAISYITTAGIKGEPITIEGLVKALIVGGMTSIIMFCGGKALKAISAKIKTIKGTNKPLQEHHYLTNKSKRYTMKFKEITDKYELDLDEKWNKELLPHQGRHPYAYHNYMLEKIKQIDSVANGNTKKFLRMFKKVKQEIRKKPEMLYKNYWLEVN